MTNYYIGIRIFRQFLGTEWKIGHFSEPFHGRNASVSLFNNTSDWT